MAFTLQTEIDTANESLLRLGCKTTITLAGYATDVNGIKANLIFPQTRDSLLRSYSWNFATARLYLASVWKTARYYAIGEYVWYPDASSTSLLYKCATAHTSGTWATDLAAVKWVIYTSRPLYHWNYQYDLPTTCLRLLTYNNSHHGYGTYYNHHYALEGDKILTDETDVKIRYIDQIIDPDNWDSLFKEVFILQLALKLLPAIGGVGTPTLNAELRSELKDVMARARVVNRNETNDTGRSDWNVARFKENKVG